LPKDIQSALSTNIDQSFFPVPVPTSSDWLSQHKEPGQTLLSFERQQMKATPHSTYKTIYVQPFQGINELRAPSLELISNFSCAFFHGCDIEVLPAVNFLPTMKRRINEWTKQEQYLVSDLLDYLNEMKSKRNMRKELVCIGVTMSDIYPGENWNFVYGQAMMTEGYGVYSFARFDPLFPYKTINIELTDEHRIIILRRAIKVFIHELMHLFGLHHCIYYLCLMNGANHEKEMDQQPLYLCPVCLRKAYSTFQFNIVDMYQTIIDHCQKLKFDYETNWYTNRLTHIKSNIIETDTKK
ncbi:unnamed protein product, partial [Didymodactylos carnosus]